MNRRRAVKPAPRRSPGWRRILLGLTGGVATLSLLFWGGTWLLAPERFVVQTVRLTTPPERVTPEALRAALLPHVSEGLLRVDVATVQAELQALPWVRSASVRRVWPDRLEIAVHEYRPVAYWGEHALVDEQGRLFVPPREEWPTGLPRLHGPEGKAGTLLARLALARQEVDALGLDVVALTVDARQAWTVRLNNGLEVLLGTDSQTARLARFVRVYGGLIGPNAERIARVDLRYTNGVALGWRDTPAGDA